jgi:hypothetical protein
MMARILFLALLFLALIGCRASLPSPQRAPLYPPGPYLTAAADILAHGRPALAAAWRQDGLDAVAAVPITGDAEHDSRARAVALQQADDAWLGVWLALADLRQADAAATAARATGKPADEERVRAALCQLQAEVPLRILVLPAIPGCP